MAQQDSLVVQFCSKIHPSQITLTAIIPDGPITTQSFYVGQKNKIDRFIEENKTKNIYFSVNPNKTLINKKPTKKDVISMDWLHVDVDPNGIGDIVQEREDLLKKINSLEHKPSLIIDSGNGYQAFWKLKEPVIINSAEHIIELESYNRQLAIILGGDNCHNIDRIMRLPFTTNWPTATKLKKGRVAGPTTIIEFNDLTYSLRSFVKAPEIIPSAKPTKKVTLSGNLPTVNIESLDVKKDVKELILTGTLEDNPNKYESRSEAAFYVVCECIRKKISHDMIASILLNKEYSFYDHVNKEGRPDNAVARLISRAMEFATHPLLAETNKKFFMVLCGSKGKIAHEYRDKVTNKLVLEFLSNAEFSNLVAYKEVEFTIKEKGEKKKVTVPLAKWWIKQESRRQYDQIIFSPGKDFEGCYNLWRGFSCEAIPGDWSLLKEHILKNLCNNNEERFNYMLNWMARVVQQPATQSQVAVVLKGGRGTGKGIFANAFGSLMSDHYVPISNKHHLIGKFNHHLERAIIVFVDEAFWAGDKANEGNFKAKITEPENLLERKGFDAKPIANYAHYVIASNEDWVVPTGFDERRFFVLDVSDERKQDTAYFGKVKKQMEKGGREAMLFDLLDRDISKFDVYHYPDTSAMHKQKLENLNVQHTFIYDCLVNGHWLDAHDKWQTIVSKSDLHLEYKMSGPRTRAGSQRQMHEQMKLIFGRVPLVISNLMRFNNGEPKLMNCQCYKLPSLGDSREKFDTFFKIKTDWPSIMEPDPEEM